jgi:hypothetical protein
MDKYTFETSFELPVGAFGALYEAINAVRKVPTYDIAIVTKHRKPTLLLHRDRKNRVSVRRLWVRQFEMKQRLNNVQIEGGIEG